jgi:hypothetical protein
MPPDNPFIRYSVDQQNDFSTLIRGARTLEHMIAAGVGDEFMFGSIEWDKSLGKPLTPEMADGFEIIVTHETIVDIGDATGGPVHPTPLITPSGTLGKWDAADENGRHHVHFVASPIKRGVIHTVEIKLAGVDWSALTLPGTWLRNMQPSARVFTKDISPAWTEPFEVIASPFIFINP